MTRRVAAVFFAAGLASDHFELQLELDLVVLDLDLDLAADLVGHVHLERARAQRQLHLLAVGERRGESGEPPGGLGAGEQLRALDLHIGHGVVLSGERVMRSADHDGAGRRIIRRG